MKFTKKFYDRIYSWENLKKIGSFLECLFLWLCVWATYNTDITRIFSTGFPHGALDFLHGIRSLFPFIALCLAIVILAKNRNLNIKSIKEPLTLLGLYAIVGIFASLLSKKSAAFFLLGNFICLGNNSYSCSSGWTQRFKKKFRL